MVLTNESIFSNGKVLFFTNKKKEGKDYVECIYKRL